MRSLRKSILIIFIFILFLELFLRGFSFFVISKNNFDKKDKGSNIVMCFGDSYTYGLGVPRGMDYPSRLEKMFKDKNVKVYNYGEPGANTTIVFNNIKKALSNIKPDVAILLAGGNNKWNLKGFSENKRSFWDFIKALKIYKLYEFLRYREFSEMINIKSDNSYIIAGNVMLDTISKVESKERYFNNKISDNSINYFVDLISQNDIPSIEYLNSKSELTNKQLLYYCIDLFRKGYLDRCRNTLNMARVKFSNDKDLYFFEIFFLSYISRYDLMYNSIENYRKKSDFDLLEEILLANSYKKNNNKELLSKSLKKIEDYGYSEYYYLLLKDKINKELVLSKNHSIEELFFLIYSDKNNDLYYDLIKNNDLNWDNPTLNFFNYLFKISGVNDKNSFQNILVSFFKSFDFSPENNKIFELNESDNILFDHKTKIKIARDFTKFVEGRDLDFLNGFENNYSSYLYKMSIIEKNIIKRFEYYKKALHHSNDKGFLVKNFLIYSNNSEIIKRNNDYIKSTLIDMYNDNIIDKDFLMDAVYMYKKIFQKDRSILLNMNDFYANLYSVLKDNNDFLREYSNSFYQLSLKYPENMNEIIKDHESLLSQNDLSFLYYNQALLLRSLKKYEESLFYAERCVEMEPENPEYIIFVAFLYTDFINSENTERFEQASKLLKKAKKILEKKKSNDMDMEKVYTSLSILYSIESQLDFSKNEDAIEWHEDNIDKAQYPRVFFNMGVLYSRRSSDLKDLKKSRSFIERALELEPENKEYKFFLWYLLKNRMDLEDEAKKYVSFDKSGNESVLRDNENDSITQWVIDDLNNIVKFLKDNGVRVIIQNYPLYPDNYTEDIARDNDIGFVDQYSAFFDNMDEVVVKEKYFFPDGHCNILGNQKMAENLYEVLK